MPQNDYNQSRQEFEQFREKLDQSFNYRRDTVMELLDALAANTTARSPVELSLSPLFRREYSALYKGIQELSRTTQTDSTEASKSQKSQQRGGISRGNLGISPAQIEARLQAISALIPTPQQKQFYLWALDVTPLPRPYAKTLSLFCHFPRIKLQ